MIGYLREKNIPLCMPTETQVGVKSKILSLDIVFTIAFQFCGERLVAITMSPDTTDNDLYSRYNEIQKALERELGHPRRGLRSIMNLLVPDSRLESWRANGVRIEHYLLNRFGMEEIIDIKR